MEVSGLKATPVRLGRATTLKVGEPVYAVGSPLGLELSLSEGLVASCRAASPLSITPNPRSPAKRRPVQRLRGTGGSYTCYLGETEREHYTGMVEYASSQQKKLREGGLKNRKPHSHLLRQEPYRQASPGRCSWPKTGSGSRTFTAAKPWLSPEMLRLGLTLD